MSADQISLVDRIYEAALLPDLWPDVIDRLSVEAGAVGGAIFSIGAVGAHWSSSHNLREGYTRFFQEGWAQRNARAEAGFAKGLVGVHRFVTEADLFDRPDFDQHPFFKDFLHLLGLGWSAGCTLALPHGDVLVITLERALAAGPVPDDAINRLNPLYADVNRAGMIAGRLAFQRIAGAVDILDRVGLPAVAVDDHGKVMLTGSLWDGAGGIWTTRGGDKLALADDRANALLSECLTSLQRDDTPKSIPLRAADGASRAVLQIVPVRREAHDVFGRSAAVLVLNAPRDGHLGSAGLIAGLLDLSPREAEIAARLAGGEVPKDIARATGRSLDTVRNQIKVLLAKTGCSRTDDVIRLLVDVLPRGATSDRR